MRAIRINLIIRHDERNYFAWYRYKEHGHEVQGTNIQELKEKAAQELKKSCNLQAVHFKETYDVTETFQEIPFINISQFADYVSLNPALLRQYVSGVKNPSREQMEKIMRGFRSATEKMNRISLAYDGQPLLDTADLTLF